MKVLYIGGAGRSGSTLLELILGNTPGFVSVGEIRFWWEYMAEGGIRCGCGALLGECPFWGDVQKRLLARNPELDILRLAMLARRLDRTHNLPAYGRTLTARDAEVAELVAATDQLYQAVWETGGGRIIVDSSKVPSHLYLLSQIAGLDLRLLQLVRDGRAVAYSWNKRHKKEPAAADGSARMARHSNLRAVLVWAIENSYVRRFGRALPRTAVMRYEDFAANPGPVLGQALQELGWPIPQLEALNQEAFYPQPTHSVGGNPLRFSRQALTVRPDTEWQEQMSPAAQKTLGLLFAPVFRRYHYAIW